MKEWKGSKTFGSMKEFEDFLQWINNEVKLNQCTEICVSSKYGNNNVWTEKWYQHKGTIWRLVWPDFPFSGIFESVPQKELDTGVWSNPDWDVSPEDKALWGNIEW